MNLTNTTVCIPGGNSGIGLELVKLLAKICKKIFVLDKDPKCEDITNLKNVEYFRLDLSHQKISNFNEQVDILIINSGLMRAEPKTFKSTTFLEIEKLIHANIRSNLRLFKDFDPKKVVIVSSMLQSSGLENKSIQSACLSFFKTFNECLQSEGVNTTIVYLSKDAKNLEAADSILHALNNDVKEVYVPSICATTESLRGILPEVALDAIVKNCASINNNFLSSGVTKIRTAIPEMGEKLSSGVKDFMNHFNNRKQETKKPSTSSKVIKKSPNSKSIEKNISDPGAVKETLPMADTNTELVNPLDRDFLTQCDSELVNQASLDFENIAHGENADSANQEIENNLNQELENLKNYSSLVMAFDEKMTEACILKIEEDFIHEPYASNMLNQLFDTLKELL